MPAKAKSLESLIPLHADDITIKVQGREVELTNLQKVFWPKDSFTKGDLLRYYATISPFLLPHLQDRAMVMKRFPHGIEGEFFFMKRIPKSHPDWMQTCSIEHDAGVINFPMIQDLPSLLWVVNLGCIDLNQWYARCDDVNRPDYLHFDLDPTEGATFATVREAALQVHRALDELGMPSYAKTTGSSGIHIYIPIVRGPLQKQVWTFAKALAFKLAEQHPETLTAQYRIAERPNDHVLVDYNQNAWGKTLASVYSVRPEAGAPVSAPVTWDEIAAGIEMCDFRIDTLAARLEETGDYWKPLLAKRGRFNLEKVL